MAVGATRRPFRLSRPGPRAVPMRPVGSGCVEIVQRTCDHRRMEKDQIDGFLLEAQASGNVTARGGGVSHLRFIAAAESADEAIGLVGNLGFQGARVIDSGPAILEHARDLRIPDHSAQTL
jgi:hypothetical protein